MLENLAAKGVKQQGHPDVQTVKMTHPEVYYGWGILSVRRGESGLWMATDAVPDAIISGYRNYNYDKEVSNSPHCFGAAIDVRISSLSSADDKNWPALLDAQIAVVRDAVVTTKIFKRGGLYPQQNTCHLDVCDEAWMRKYRGTRFWVKWPHKKKSYHGFWLFEDAVRFAKSKLEKHFRGE
jgi:hypothetical protein